MNIRRLLVASWAFILICFPANAETVEIDGIWYNLSKNIAEVTNNPNGYSGDIVIPDEVLYGGETYIVKTIQGHSESSYSGVGPDGSHKEYPAAFENCIDLVSITIGDKVETIGAGAFSGCVNLRKVTFGKSIKSFYSEYIHRAANTEMYYYIYKKAILFKGCENITDILCYAEVCPDFISYNKNSSYSLVKIHNSDFDWFDNEDAYTRVTLHVCDKYVEAFKTSKGWVKFGNIVVFDKVTDFKLTYFVDGEVFKTETHKYEDNIIPEAELSKIGYTFSGWSEIPSNMPGKDVNIYGTFILNNYKLNYMVDGVKYASYNVPYNATIITLSGLYGPPREPYMENYEFIGWSEIPEKMPDHDVIITGLFKKVSTDIDGIKYKFNEKEAYVIQAKNVSGDVTIPSTFEDEGIIYTVTSIEKDVFKNNTRITSVGIPNSVLYIKDGVFNGCKNMKNVEIGSGIVFIGERTFANIDKLNDVTILAEKLPETDRTAFENSYIEDYVTLHVSGGSIKEYRKTAPWKNFKEIVPIEGTEVVLSYKITYLVDGEIYKTYEINEGERIISEDEPTKEGYIFSGWSEIPQNMPAEDIIISGTFTKGIFTITYILDGMIYKTDTYEYNARIVPLYLVKKEGYTFSGWDYEPSVMPGYDVTVTGFYTINKYSLIYMVDDMIYKAIDVEYGANITAEEEPTKDGYQFSGWSWIPNKMPAYNVIITGSFTKVDYEMDGIIYEINDDGATIINTVSVSGDVVIKPTIIINNITYNVTAIGQSAFNNNKNITSVSIPDGITKIGDRAFDGCTGIIKLTLGKDVRNIGKMAFANIGKSVFVRNRAVKEPLIIECYAESVPIAYSDSFEGIDGEFAILKVNDYLLEAYKSISPWNKFDKIVSFNDTMGINAVYSAEHGMSVYSIDGRKIDKKQKGVNIIRTSQGTKIFIAK